MTLRDSRQSAADFPHSIQLFWLAALVLFASACRPCERLDERICRDLGNDCAVWRQHPEIRSVVLPSNEVRGRVARAQCDIFAEESTYQSRTLPMVRNLITQQRTPGAQILPVATGAIPSSDGSSAYYLLPIVMIVAMMGYSMFAWRRAMSGAQQRNEAASALQAQAIAQMQMQQGQQATPWAGAVAPQNPAGWGAPPGAPNAAWTPNAPPPGGPAWGAPMGAPMPASSLAANVAALPMHPQFGRAVSVHAGRMLAGGWVIYVGAILVVSGVFQGVKGLTEDADPSTLGGMLAALFIGATMLLYCVSLWRQQLVVHERGLVLRRWTGVREVPFAAITNIDAVRHISRSGNTLEIEIVLTNGSVTFTDALEGVESIVPMLQALPRHHG